MVKEKRKNITTFVQRQGEFPVAGTTSFTKDKKYNTTEKEKYIAKEISEVFP